MKIIEKTYSWSGNLEARPKTNYILLHHAAASGCSADDIHTIHLKNGWAGIGYHFYVRKDGCVYRGRPIDKTGAHVSGYNSQCLGVCFEGNFETEEMTELQIMAGRELIAYLKGIYPKAQIKRHKDLNATACPGKNFPFEEIKNGEITAAADIVKALNQRGIITNTELWNAKCAADDKAYWLARKLCNMTVNGERKPKLDSVNDIVWELSHRGIITDMSLWLRLMEDDKDLYWLGYKGCNMTRNEV